MDELYGWLAERYECDFEEMRLSSRFWAGLGIGALIVGVGVLSRLLPLLAAKPGSFLAQVGARLPPWLPEAGFWLGYAGLLCALYGWLLGGSAKRFRNSV